MFPFRLNDAYVSSPSLPRGRRQINVKSWSNCLLLLLYPPHPPRLFPDEESIMDFIAPTSSFSRLRRLLLWLVITSQHLPVSECPGVARKPRVLRSSLACAVPILAAPLAESAAWLSKGQGWLYLGLNMTASRGKSAHQAHFAPRRACAVCLQSRIVSGSTGETSGNAGLPLVHMATRLRFSQRRSTWALLSARTCRLPAYYVSRPFLFSAGERRRAQLWRNDICTAAHDYLNAIRSLAGPRGRRTVSRRDTGATRLPVVLAHWLAYIVWAKVKQRWYL